MASVSEGSSLCLSVSKAPAFAQYTSYGRNIFAIAGNHDAKSSEVVAYNDKEFGFLRLTIDINQKTVIGEFFSAYDESNPSAALPVLSGSFTLNLQKHTID